MKVIIVDAGHSSIDSELRAELLDWAQSLGVDPVRTTTKFAIARDADGVAAHFSMKLQRDGHDYVLPGANRVATDFGSVVVRVESGSWPSWFGDPVEVPEMPISALLEVATAAQDAHYCMLWAIEARSRRTELTVTE